MNTVAVLARTQSEVERTAARIRADGGSSVALTGDVSDHGSATQIVAAAKQDLQGPIAILVNAAGVTGPVEELTEIDMDRWRETLDINLNGALAMCRAVLPDDLAGEAHSIYDPTVRTRSPAGSYRLGHRRSPQVPNHQPPLTCNT